MTSLLCTSLTNLPILKRGTGAGNHNVKHGLTCTQTGCLFFGTTSKMLYLQTAQVLVTFLWEDLVYSKLTYLGCYICTIMVAFIQTWIILLFGIISTYSTWMTKDKSKLNRFYYRDVKIRLWVLSGDMQDTDNIHCGNLACVLQGSKRVKQKDRAAQFGSQDQNS